MSYHNVRALIGMVMLGGCAVEPWPPAPPVAPDQYAAEFDEWRAERRERLVTPPSGPVLWIVLHELAQGPTPFGSDPEAPITLPATSSPPVAGTFVRSGQTVRLELAPGSSLTLADGSLITEPLDMGNDRSEDITELAMGSLGIRVHAEPGTDRLWVRVWDREIPEKETFELPEAFALDPAWRVAARFDRYPEPRSLPVSDVLSGTIEYQTPGDLVFRFNGAEHRLTAIQNPNSERFFIMMWDSTAAAATYPSGRYLGVPLADSTGWTTIDFNRAYNAPCAFTAYSVCGLPPLENRLALAVTAGEKRPAY